MIRYSLIPSLARCVAGALFTVFCTAISAAAPPLLAEEPAESEGEHVVELSLDDDRYTVSIDTSGSPDLSEWAKRELAPVVSVWYPLIVRMLPSNDFEAPKHVDIRIDDAVGGVAYASGNRIRGNGNWFRKQLDGEARGAIVHELVHVAQRYGGQGGGAPGWLVEGIPDYIRWFLYEPETGGAVIGPGRAARVSHDDSYRISANFLSWVANRHGASLVPKLNARLREGRYDEQFWQEYTGASLDELAGGWKQELRSPDEPAGEAVNQLTEREAQQGWRLLFDGTTLDGWHSFHHDRPLPGWKAKDDALVCDDPRNAGDLCTHDLYQWFDLRLEYKITPGGNSGVMYRVSKEGPIAWATGPELQLLDNALGGGPVRAGWLYALCEPPKDEDTGEPIDATLPAGQWNQVRLLIAPNRCEHWINGVKYLDYQLGSDDFNQRVAASKFGTMAGFAKSPAGMIALQGDHGRVAFRNVKIRPLQD